jgi:GNAT superfamily N-acetyltransferase
VIIRLAGPDDVPAAQEVERRAVVLFEAWLDETGLTPQVLHDTSEADELLAAVRRGHLLVAVEDDRVIGFAQMAILDGLVHVDELDVVPERGRQGVGSRLLQTVIDWAAEHGYPAVTLSTFRDVPWNRPFYARRGFAEVASLADLPEHRALVEAERRRGLSIDRRLIMRRDTFESDVRPDELTNER